MNLVWNIFLALVWLALSEDFSLGNLVIGFMLGYIILRIVQPQRKHARYLLKTYRFLSLLGFFLSQMVRASVKMVVFIFKPDRQIKPGVIVLPLDIKTDAEIFFLTSMITMTPGTLCLDLSKDRERLYIHSIFIDDPELLRQHIKHNWEHRIRELLQ